MPLGAPSFGSITALLAFFRHGTPRATSPGMKLDEIIASALHSSSPKLAAQAADIMRTRMGMTYNESFARVQKVVPGTDVGTWDALLQEADEEAGGDRCR